MWGKMDNQARQPVSESGSPQWYIVCVWWGGGGENTRGTNGCVEGGRGGTFHNGCFDSRVRN